MLKTIISAAILSCTMTQAFAFEVECRDAAEAVRAKKHGYTCAPNRDEALLKTTLKRQHKQCEMELKNLGCQPMDPADDSGCMIGKEGITSGLYAGNTQTNYVAYFNQRLKLTTVIKADSCKIDQVYFAGKLTKFELFDNKLFALVNGKPMLFDEKAKLQELLSKKSNSYNDGNASISNIQATVDGRALVLTRDISKNTQTQQLIKIESSEVTKKRLKETQSSEWVQRYISELGVTADVYR